MSYIDLNAKVDVTCPGCSHVTKVKLKAMKESTGYQCKGCNEQVTFKDEGFTEGLKNVEDALSKFAKKFK